MELREINLEVVDELAIVRINRPPANALAPDLLDEGRALAAELGRKRPRAVILTGSGDFFSAGVDLKLAPTLSGDDQRRMFTGINELFLAWYGLARPVVAAVNGHAVAGGLILGLCADYRIAAEGARYGLTEGRAGIPYPPAAIGITRAELSPGTARRLVLRASLIEAGEARDWGVLDEVVTAGEVESRALTVARELAELPPQTYAEVKHQLRGPAIEAIRGELQDAAAAGEWLSEETARAAEGILRPREAR